MLFFFRSGRKAGSYLLASADDADDAGDADDAELAKTLLPTAFDRIISGSRTTPAQPMWDLCNRPPVFYNDNYDLASLSPVDLVKNYSLYD
jgi:hypothetical protein